MKKLAKVFSIFVAWIWSFLPYRFNLFFGKILAFLWIDLFQIRKKVIFDNLTLAFPNLSQHQKKKLARQSMQNLCRSFFDVIKIPSLSDSWIEKNVIFKGLENLQNLRTEKSDKKGVFFISLHLGSGDLSSAIISRKVMPVYLITKRFKNVFLDQFWFALRGASTVRFIDAHSKRNAFEILAGLKLGSGIIFVLDQFMGKPYGIETTFFGRKTGSAYGLSLFVKKTKAPVIPIYTFWGKDEKLHINFSERIDLSPYDNDDEENFKRNVTNRFNLELEKIIRQHPEHWMWVHRRWKEFE